MTINWDAEDERRAFERAAVEAAKAGRARYRSNLLECSRCGNQEHQRRTGWFRDEDYHELLQAYFEMEGRARRAEARLHEQKVETAWWQEHASFCLDQAVTLSGILLESEDPRTP